MNIFSGTIPILGVWRPSTRQHGNIHTCKSSISHDIIYVCIYKCVYINVFMVVYEHINDYIYHFIYNHNLLVGKSLVDAYNQVVSPQGGLLCAICTVIQHLNLSLFQSYNIYLATPMTYQHNISIK